MKYYFSLLLLQPYLTFGLGYYTADIYEIDKDTDRGYNLGAGVEISLGKKIALLGEVRYHRIKLLIDDKEFKVGDLVKVLDTENIKKWIHGKEAIGYTFKIGNPDGENNDSCFLKLLKNFNTKSIALCIDPTNRYCINYHKKDLKIIRRDYIKPSISELETWQKEFPHLKSYIKDCLKNA